MQCCVTHISTYFHPVSDRLAGKSGQGRKPNNLTESSMKRSFGGAGVTIDRTFELAFQLTI
jgi:hypothetical protein